MAEAAHKTAATHSGQNVPSIFDVLAQESLMSGLRPAFKHLIKYLATNFPEKCGLLFRWFDEIYGGLDLLLENHYLKKYSASFAENFYGMRRAGVHSGGYLSGVERLRSLAFLVLVPYVKLKVDKLHEKFKLRQANRGKNYNPSKLDQLIAAFFAAYPMINASMEMWTLALQVAYIVSKSSVHSPFLILAGCKLTNLTPEDVANFGDAKLELPANASIIQRIVYLLRQLSRGTFNVISRLLGVGLFFLQFLDWWFSRDGAQNTKGLNALPIPPAPQTVYKPNQVVRMDPKLCPLCKKRRTNDTVLAVSGYVFCYGCIFRYLEVNKSCPVTKLPAKTEHLIRIFANANGLNQ